jgi:hypothetical protein
MEALQESKNGNVTGREGSHWSEICAAAENPEFKPSDFVRLIVSEMALVYRELQSTAGHPSLEFKIKPLLAEIQALRAMAETARGFPELLTESDNVNLDGPKFEYICSTLMEATQAIVRELFKGHLAVDTFAWSLREKLIALEEDWRRNLDNPQLLMAHKEEMRRKREESKKNQSMYPPRSPAS